MLKIKDNVDLKELEKYGFVYRKIYDNYMYLSSKENYIDKTDNYLQIDDRRLSGFTRDLIGHEELFNPAQAIIKDEYLDLLYDLIKDGLVEKIETEKQYGKRSLERHRRI